MPIAKEVNTQTKEDLPIFFSTAMSHTKPTVTKCIYQKEIERWQLGADKALLDNGYIKEITSIDHSETYYLYP